MFFLLFKVILMQTIKDGRHINRINKPFKMFICLQFVLQSFTELSLKICLVN